MLAKGNLSVVSMLTFLFSVFVFVVFRSVQIQFSILPVLAVAVKSGLRATPTQANPIFQNPFFFFSAGTNTSGRRRQTQTPNRPFPIQPKPSNNTREVDIYYFHAMPTLKCIDSCNKWPTKASSRKKDISARQRGLKPTRKRCKKIDDDDKLNPEPEAVGEVVAILDGGTGNKSKSIPQAADVPANNACDSNSDTIQRVSIKTESESLETKIAVHQEDREINTTTSNNKTNNMSNKDFILSGTDSSGIIITTSLKFVPMNKTKFLAALTEKGIQYRPKHWKGPLHEYSLERGSDTTEQSVKGMSSTTTTLANLYLNDDIQEMWELSFNPKTMESDAAPTIEFRGVLSTQHHTVFVNDIKVSDGDTLSIKDSDILHFFNHNIHPQFAFAFIVELSMMTIELA